MTLRSRRHLYVQMVTGGLLYYFAFFFLSQNYPSCRFVYTIFATNGLTRCPAVSPWSLQLSNGPVGVSRKRPSEGNYEKEKEHCITLFDQWSEADQVEFVERLISRMCHYQHGHINSYLKPMLQRDFITALPGKKTKQMRCSLVWRELRHC